MANQLYIIRHGESAMNTNPHLISGRSNETPLTQRGIHQAKRLGSYFLSNGISPTRVYASPAMRTLQTAEHTLGSMQIAMEIVSADAIQELDQGDSVGRLRTDVYTPDTLDEICRQGKDFKLPGGESMNETGTRMLNWVDATIPIVGEFEMERTFVFGHGMAIKTLASTIHDWSHAQTYEWVVGNTSVSLFTHHDGQWQLEYLGRMPE